MSELAAALVAALADLTVVEKAHTANAGSYSYDYASLDDLVKLTRPALAKQGIVALTPVHAHGDGLACTVTLIHTSGESMPFEPLSFPCGKDAQSTGSWITYFRRYALLASLGMATGEDDDGAKAVPAEPVTVPGFRTSLLAAVANLSADEKDLLRAHLGEQGLPNRAYDMTEEQCNVVLDWILHGMPKVES